MTRVLHVLGSPHLGGAEWMCLYLAQEQQARGHDVHVHFFDAGPASTQARELGLHVSTQNVTTFVRRARWRGFAHGLQRAVQLHSPDIVHSHVPLTNLICHRTLPRMRIPWICTIHGSWRQFAYAPQTVKRPWLKPYLLARHALGDRLATRSAARIVAVSDDTRHGLSRIGIPARKIVMILNGLPANAEPLSSAEGRRRFGLPPDALVIGALGHFSPVKGFDILVDAFVRIAPSHRDTLLLIAGGDVLGDTGYRDKLNKRINETGLTDRVRLLPALDPRAGFLAALDIFAISSLTEGLPLALIEAMQHSKPSVVTSAGGSLEAARPEREALVFRSGDPRELARQLERLIKDPTLRGQLGHAARERAESHLTIARCCDEYDAAYRSIFVKSS